MQVSRDRIYEDGRYCARRSEVRGSYLVWDQRGFDDTSTVKIKIWGPGQKAEVEQPERTVDNEMRGLYEVRVRRGDVWKIDNVSGCAKILLYASGSVEASLLLWRRTAAHSKTCRE